MVFVCALTTRSARDWCDANGISPHGNLTRVVTPLSPHGMRGRTLADDDRVVVLVSEDDWNEDDRWMRVRVTLAPCMVGTTVRPEFVT